jgi:hypothetical protein
MNRARIAVSVFLLLVSPWAQSEFSAAEVQTSGFTVSSSSDRDRLIGTWKLVSAGTFRSDGKFEPYPEYGPNPIGYLMYDPTGHMCVSLSNPNHPNWANPEKPTDAEKLRSYDAFFAYLRLWIPTILSVSTSILVAR